MSAAATKRAADAGSDEEDDDNDEDDEDVTDAASMDIGAESASPFASTLAFPAQFPLASKAATLQQEGKLFPMPRNKKSAFWKAIRIVTTSAVSPSMLCQT